MILTDKQITEMEQVTVAAFGWTLAAQWWGTPHSKMGWVRPCHVILAEGGDQRVYDFIKRAEATGHAAKALESEV